MDRGRLLIIAILALAVSAIVYRTLQVRTGSSKRVSVDVLVAATDIPVGTELTERNVKVVTITAEDVPAGVFQSKVRVSGRGVVLPIEKGEFILPFKLAAENTSELFRPGMRAFPLRANEVLSVADSVSPGNRVNVLRACRDERPTTLLKNVSVLAVGQRRRPATSEPQTAQVITLLVSPEDAQKLARERRRCRIQIDSAELNKSGSTRRSEHSFLRRLGRGLF